MPVNPIPSRPAVQRLRARFGTPGSAAGDAASGSGAGAARGTGAAPGAGTAGGAGAAITGAAQRAMRPVLDRLGMRAVAAVRPELDDLRAQLDGVRAELVAVRAELAAALQRIDADVELARAELAGRSPE